MLGMEVSFAASVFILSSPEMRISHSNRINKRPMPLRWLKQQLEILHRHWTNENGPSTWKQRLDDQSEWVELYLLESIVEKWTRIQRALLLLCNALTIHSNDLYFKLCVLSIKQITFWFSFTLVLYNAVYVLNAPWLSISLTLFLSCFERLSCLHRYLKLSIFPFFSFLPYFVYFYAVFFSSFSWIPHLVPLQVNHFYFLHISQYIFFMQNLQPFWYSMHSRLHTHKTYACTIRHSSILLHICFSTLVLCVCVCVCPFYVYEEYLYLVWRQSSVWVHLYLSFIISG